MWTSCPADEVGGHLSPAGLGVAVIDTSTHKGSLLLQDWAPNQGEGQQPAQRPRVIRPMCHQSTQLLQAPHSEPLG